MNVFPHENCPHYSTYNTTDCIADSRDRGVDHNGSGPPVWRPDSLGLRSHDGVRAQLLGQAKHLSALVAHG